MLDKFNSAKHPTVERNNIDNRIVITFRLIADRNEP